MLKYLTFTEKDLDLLLKTEFNQNKKTASNNFEAVFFSSNVPS
jgi:hypothetical protein